MVAREDETEALVLVRESMEGAGLWREGSCRLAKGKAGGRS